MDDDPLIGQLLLQLALILVNAVFACAEIALLSVNDTKLDRMAADGNKKARRLLSLTKQPARFLATIQVGITLAGFWAAPLRRITFPKSSPPSLFPPVCPWRPLP